MSLRYHRLRGAPRIQGAENKGELMASLVMGWDREGDVVLWNFPEVDRDLLPGDSPVVPRDVRPSVCGHQLSHHLRITYLIS